MPTLRSLNTDHYLCLEHYPKILHLFDSSSDVVTIEKTGDFFRLLYDIKGRYTLHKITPEEAKVSPLFNWFKVMESNWFILCFQYKLCRVKKVSVGPKGIPFIVTHDGRTIRYPDPLIKVHDSIRYDIGTGKILDFIKFETGNLCMVTGGHNLGRVGVITSRERHPGSFDIVHVKDSQGHTFATRYVAPPFPLSYFWPLMTILGLNDNYLIFMISLSEH